MKEFQLSRSKLFPKFRPQFRRDFFQRFRQDSRVRQHRHEIRVAVPARHDVDVQMFRDARTRATSTEVDAHVESVRLHHGGERGEATARELPQIREFLVRQAVQVWRLPCKARSSNARRRRDNGSTARNM